MSSESLNAISPIDGRYFSKVSSLSNYYSEFALIRYRVRVEIEYLIALAHGPLSNQLGNISKSESNLRKVYQDFNMTDALSIKETESRINHDVKAVEYFVKEKLNEEGLGDLKEYVHFGLTSQDINNTAIPLSITESLNEVMIPELKNVIAELKNLSASWKNRIMLARTHGQAASPTSLGKEMFVFVERLQNQLDTLEKSEHQAKFGGATGNFNAHHVAFPDVNWPVFGDEFVKTHLGLKRSRFTTQIEHYDQMAAVFDNIRRINTILIDLDRDVWQYISMGYFKQKVNPGEVGSSAMPHKVNPIDFENSEGNLGMANAIFEHLSAKLPISRLQRDLTDSTVLRNIGVPMAHTLLAWKSLMKGLGKIEVNDKIIENDLDDNWAVVAEAIQTILRREHYPNPYESLKELTRGSDKITSEKIADFIDGLDVSEELKQELLKITPSNYSGMYPDF
jgi:adenylosuccinate lyase